MKGRRTRFARSDIGFSVDKQIDCFARGDIVNKHTLFLNHTLSLRKLSQSESAFEAYVSCGTVLVVF